MKLIYLTVTIEVPDDETEKHWPNVLNDIEALVAAKGYYIYDKDWGNLC